MIIGVAGCGVPPSTPPRTGTNGGVDAAPSASSAPPLTGDDGPFLTAPLEQSLTSVGPDGPFLSQGHGRGRFSTRLRASDQAAFESPTAPPPDGFVVCAQHTHPDDTTRLFCMRRRAATEGGWDYQTSNGYGQKAIRVGQLADCAACHAVAPRSGLFSPPR